MAKKCEQVARLIGIIKSAQGRCVDKEPHEEIRELLQMALSAAYKLMPKPRKGE